jgi:hypothetical protein
LHSIHIFLLSCPGIALVNQSLAALANTVRYEFLTFLRTLDANASWFIALRTNQHDIGDINRGFELNTPRLNVATLARLGLFLVFGAEIDTLHNHPAFLRVYPDDLAALAFVFETATDNFDSIAFTDFYIHGFTPHWPRGLPAPVKQSS